MSDFRKALLWTAVPIVVLSLVSSAWKIPLLEFSRIQLVWFLAAFFALVALVVGLVALFTGKKAQAGGIFAGLAIGVLSLGASRILFIRGI